MKRTIAACLIILSSCLTAVADTAYENKDDQLARLWHIANKIDAHLAKNGRLYEDEQTTRYIKGLLDKLYPPAKNLTRVHLYYSPHFNAFTLPNGSIYINLGFLAQMENEAQLVALLAHEGAHFFYNHSMQRQEGVKFAASGLGFYSVSHVLHQISGYSRKMEREADKFGFMRIVANGYDAQEAVNMLKLLLREQIELGVEEPSEYSSHPRLEDRIENLSRLSRGKDGGIVERKAFASAVANARLEAMKLDASRYRFDRILRTASDTARMAEYPAQAWFYVGEAYMRRNSQNDRWRAEDAFQKAVVEAPEFAPAYAAWGILQLQNNEYAQAKAHFEKYLQLDPKAYDRAFILEYIKECEGRL